jgi:hypothetical protein
MASKDALLSYERSEHQANQHTSKVDGPEGPYPCQSFTGTLRSLLAVGFELALMLLIPMSILHVSGSRLFAVVRCDMVLRRNYNNLLGMMVLAKW